MKVVKVPSMDICTKTFGIENGKKFHFAMCEAAFRNDTSLKEQIKIIRSHLPNASVNNICSVLGISTYCYYKALNDIPSFYHSTRVPPSQQLLSDAVEQKIIDEIKLHQINKDCLTGQDIRNFAAEIYKEETGIEKEFTRDWCRDFKIRHSDSIEKVKVGCLNKKRASISQEQVEKYITDVEDVLKDPTPPCLLLNFDETGFSKRPDKGKRKTVFVCKNCNVTPYWREESDIHHISLVACISAECKSLKPPILSTRAKMDKDIDQTFFAQWASYCKTKKGYKTQESMLFWLKDIIASYVSEKWKELNGNYRCVIIFDSCSAHFSEEITQILSEIGNISFLPIPAHSSHLTQMLDATVFGALKRRYKSTPCDKRIKSRFTQKLIRVKIAYQQTMSQELINT